jgi:hypothetical protein
MRDPSCLIDVRQWAGQGPDLQVHGVTSAGSLAHIEGVPNARKMCVPGREMSCGPNAPVRFVVPDPDFLKENRAEFDNSSEKWVIRERGRVYDYFYYIPAMWGLRIGS